MAKDISRIVTTAEVTSILNNGSADVLVGTGASNAYYFSEGRSGHDTISSFTSRDSILVDHRLFDGNGDGIIALGKNGVLDIDRISKSKAGPDTVALNGLSELGLRYLGTIDGVSTYADASTKQAGWIEGTIGNDDFNPLPKTTDIYFYDTALGLNLGNDIIRDWSRDDRIITTSPLHAVDPENPFEANGQFVPISDVPVDSEGYLQPAITYYLGSNSDGSAQGTVITIFHTSEEIALRLSEIRVEEDATYYFYYGYLTGSG